MRSVAGLLPRALGLKRTGTNEQRRLHAVRAALWPCLDSAARR